MKDVAEYVRKYNLKHVTTAVILVAALDAGLIDETAGNQIWHDMLDKKRMLPANSFTDFLKMFKE